MKRAVMPNFDFAFDQHLFGISKDVCNSRLAQLIQKQQLVKFESRIKISILFHSADTFNFDQLPFLSQLSQEEVTYLFGKAKSMLIESKIQIKHYSMFDIPQANFKSAHLLNKMALVQFQCSRTVYSSFFGSQNYSPAPLKLNKGHFIK